MHFGSNMLFLLFFSSLTPTFMSARETYDPNVQAHRFSISTLFNFNTLGTIFTYCKKCWESLWHKHTDPTFPVPTFKESVYDEPFLATERLRQLEKNGVTEVKVLKEPTDFHIDDCGVLHDFMSCTFEREEVIPVPQKNNTIKQMKLIPMSFIDYRNLYFPSQEELESIAFTGTFNDEEAMLLAKQFFISAENKEEPSPLKVLKSPEIIEVGTSITLRTLKNEAKSFLLSLNGIKRTIKTTYQAKNVSYYFEGDQNGITTIYHSITPERPPSNIEEPIAFLSHTYNTSSPLTQAVNAYAQVYKGEKRKWGKPDSDWNKDENGNHILTEDQMRESSYDYIERMRQLAEEHLTAARYNVDNSWFWTRSDKYKKMIKEMDNRRFWELRESEQYTLALIQDCFNSPLDFFPNSFEKILGYTKPQKHSLALAILFQYKKELPNRFNNCGSDLERQFNPLMVVRGQVDRKYNDICGTIRMIDEQLTEEQ